MFKVRKITVLACLMLFFGTFAFAHVGPDQNLKPVKKNTSSFRGAPCSETTTDIDLDINNVRARLNVGGDVWWDLSDPKYIVPKIDPASGLPEVSSIFAGAVWLGGFDQNANLKMACQSYRTGGRNDFWAGPLDEQTGITESAICADWDKMFEVFGKDIDAHIAAFQKSQEPGADPFDCSMLGRGIRGWPARGNEEFANIHGFSLPNQDLAPFFDYDNDDLYDPCQGDYPIIVIRGCESEANYADQMVFWVYNDEGGGEVHSNSGGIAIRMEVQALAFAWESNDEIDNMSFIRYKLINRANDPIVDTYFAMWVDADLGCPDDDYIGCDTTRSLAVTYNRTEIDGPSGVDCQGAATYGNDVPLLGIDYFRGPLDSAGNELGMSSFTYYIRSDVAPVPQMGDPSADIEFYNYLTGNWRDGRGYTPVGLGYNAGNPNEIDFAFPDKPNDPSGWSMCNAVGNFLDTRTIQASGPLVLLPGRKNELIVGVTWVPDVLYPCPGWDELLFSDDIAQGLFDACFDIVDGPDAPDLGIVELDQELVLCLTNATTSNNYKESYEEADPALSTLTDDTLYKFEGYIVYQLADDLVQTSELDDPDKSRIVFKADIRNGISEIYNWDFHPTLTNPGGGKIAIPTIQIDGNDEGITHTFNVTDDQFATGNDKTLINHKTYYFLALAYAYNNYEEFDATSNSGQRRAYLGGRRNVKITSAIPRINTPENYGTVINASYGDVPSVTRVDGVGNGGLFPELDEATTREIVDNYSAKRLTYEKGASPIDIKVVNPLKLQAGNYRLEILDNTPGDQTLDPDAGWKLTNVSTGDIYNSEQSIQLLNEQLLLDIGLSVGIVQSIHPSPAVAGIGNGYVGSKIEYKNDGNQWFQAVTDGGNFGQDFVSIFLNTNFLETGVGEVDINLDPNQVFSNVAQGYFYPFYLMNNSPVGVPGPYLISSGLMDDNNPFRSAFITHTVDNVRNVDIVMTSNKDDWSKCIVVETSTSEYSQATGLGTKNGEKNFELRKDVSLNKEGVDDQSGTVGYSYFPGYALDPITGERLNIFFGENSSFNNDFGLGLPDNGGDMIWNPTDELFVGTGTQPSLLNFPMGGGHWIYVTEDAYDECAYYHSQLNGGTALNVARVASKVIWTSMAMVEFGEELNSVADGLIPNDVEIKIRVNDEYDVEVATGDYNGYPTYEFSIGGEQAVVTNNAAAMEEALDLINAVPNPYYAYSPYEREQLDNIVKITNLPPDANITIYSLDGKFIRQYERNARISNSGAEAKEQIVTSLDWDLKNFKGIPVSSGVYLIHVEVPNVGEKVIKWFGIQRQFDASGLN